MGGCLNCGAAGNDLPNTDQFKCPVLQQVGLAGREMMVRVLSYSINQSANSVTNVADNYRD